MRPADGRVVSSFITQALIGEPLTIYGDGSQTRSFCYVDDLVAGLVAMIEPMWPGRSTSATRDEFTMLELAKMVLELTAAPSSIEFHPFRWTTRAAAVRTSPWPARSWAGHRSRTPKTGLLLTIEYFRAHPQEVAEAALAVSGPQDEGRRPMRAAAVHA